MDNRPVVWDNSNRRHILGDHPERRITAQEVEEALQDANRIETNEVRSSVNYHTVIGMTGGGRLLVVDWVDDPGGRFPIHARQASRRAARRYYR
jgi:uncharacterized DUF497 family protein